MVLPTFNEMAFSNNASHFSRVPFSIMLSASFSKPIQVCYGVEAFAFIALR